MELRGIPVLVAASREELVVGARLVVQPQVRALARSRYRDVLLEGAHPPTPDVAVRQRLEEVHDVLGDRADAVGRDHVARERLAGERIRDVIVEWEKSPLRSAWVGKVAVPPPWIDLSRSPS